MSIEEAEVRPPTAAASAPIALLNAQSKAAVILLHGITCTPNEMADVAAYLHDKGFDVFVPCLSGHGTSLDNLRNTPAERWFADVSAEIKQVQNRNYSKIFIGGQSFGALLALWGAEHFQKTFNGLILLSLPLRFRSFKREVLLGILAFLPDSVLNRLWIVPKRPRPKGTFDRIRYCYNGHALGAGARVVYVRRIVERMLPSVTSPMLLLHDPNDHHLSAAAPRLLRRRAGAEVRSRWFAGGQHELTDGHMRHAVAEEIAAFIQALT